MPDPAGAGLGTIAVEIEIRAAVGEIDEFNAVAVKVQHDRRQQIDRRAALELGGLDADQRVGPVIAVGDAVIVPDRDRPGGGGDRVAGNVAGEDRGVLAGSAINRVAAGSADQPVVARAAL